MKKNDIFTLANFYIFSLALTTKWLYAFRDARKAAKEERDWLTYAKKTGNYKLDVLHKKQRVFGTVVLECDLDLEPEIAYKAYSKR